MTEERVKELMGVWGENNPKVVARACLVAAESQKEGIDEMRDVICRVPVSHRTREYLDSTAERLKEQGKCGG